MSEPLDLEERLANLISDGTAPRLVPDVEIVAWRRTQVVVAEVHPSSGRTHYLKREGLDRGVYVRVEELRRYARTETDDEQPMPELDSEALDFRGARTRLGA